MKTQLGRAIEYLERIGWSAGIVERKVSRLVTHDLFGFADLVAVNERNDAPTLAVQVTSADGGNVAARLKKVLNNADALRCLRAGWRIEIWGIRNNPDKKGKYLKARTLVLEDEQVRVVNGSLVLDV